MASDFPDEQTPEPVVLRPGMSAIEADYEFLSNELRRVRLELAAATAQRDELQIQCDSLRATLKRLTRKNL